MRIATLDIENCSPASKVRVSTEKGSGLLSNNSTGSTIPLKRSPTGKFTSPDMGGYIIYPVQEIVPMILFFLRSVEMCLESIRPSLFQPQHHLGENGTRSLISDPPRSEIQASLKNWCTKRNLLIEENNISNGGYFKMCHCHDILKFLPMVAIFF